MHYAVIALIEPSEDANAIDHERWRIFEVFKGPSALQMPLHVTLCKWHSIGQDTARIRRAWHRRPLALTLRIGAPALSADMKGVWCPVQNENVLRATALAVRKCITTARARHMRFLPVGRPHITLAYKDYSRSRLDEIVHYSRGVRNRSEGIVKTAVTVLAYSRGQAQWTLAS
jgi:2'-5' RNA ligase